MNNDWVHYDSSPSLIIDKIKRIIPFYSNYKFDKNVKFLNIIKNFPLKDGSVDVILCSHVLEHLSYVDFHKTLHNVYRVLKRGGFIRIIVPNLNYYINNYMTSDSDNPSLEFMKKTFLGYEASRYESLKSKVRYCFGSSRHLWMWDKKTLLNTLKTINFSKIKAVNEEDNNLEIFKDVYTRTYDIEDIIIDCYK